MASPAAERMTLEAFLDFDDGTETRYELIDGALVAMAPAAPAHALISTNISASIRGALPSSCLILSGAGVARDDPRWIVQDFIGDAEVALEALDQPLRLEAIYENVELEPGEPEAPPQEGGSVP